MFQDCVTPSSGNQDDQSITSGRNGSGTEHLVFIAGHPSKYWPRSLALIQPTMPVLQPPLHLSSQLCSVSFYVIFIMYPISIASKKYRLCFTANFYPRPVLAFGYCRCLRLSHLVVRIASNVLTEHCCQVCILAMMFCRSDCRLCAAMCGKWLRNQGNSSYQRTTCFGLLTLRHSKMGYEKYSLHLIFTFYLNRVTSVLELFPVIVFQ